MGIDHDVVASREMITELERDNHEKHYRLGLARERVNGLLARLKFLEQQVDIDEQSR